MNKEKTQPPAESKVQNISKQKAEQDNATILGGKMIIEIMDEIHMKDNLKNRGTKREVVQSPRLHQMQKAQFKISTNFQPPNMKDGVDMLTWGTKQAKNLLAEVEKEQRT